MRRLFSTADSGLTIASLKWGERTGRWRRVQRGVYAEGPEPVSEFDRQRARVLASSTAARGALAGLLLGLDSVDLDGRPTRRGALDAGRVVIVEGLPCANGLQALIDLAPLVGDDAWEQMLESALRKRLVSVVDFDEVPPRTPGLARIRRVLARRPVGAPPTESLLETLALQLARTIPDLGEPERQHVVRWPDGEFVARIDLSWPLLGMFLELDGQHHKDQPVYDARRETAVVAATGWLPVRATWHEVTRIPTSTARRWAAVVARCSERSPT